MGFSFQCSASAGCTVRRLHFQLIFLLCLYDLPRKPCVAMKCFLRGFDSRKGCLHSMYGGVFAHLTSSNVGVGGVLMPCFVMFFHGF